MPGTADGDGVSRRQVLGRAGSVHHEADQYRCWRCMDLPDTCSHRFLVRFLVRTGESNPLQPSGVHTSLSYKAHIKKTKKKVGTVKEKYLGVTMNATHESIRTMQNCSVYKCIQVLGE